MGGLAVEASFAVWACLFGLAFLSGGAFYSAGVRTGRRLERRWVCDMYLRGKKLPASYIPPDMLRSRVLHRLVEM